MTTERLVRAISWSLSSSWAPPSFPDDLPFSTAWARFCSWRVASGRAWLTSSSISPISRVRRSTSRLARSAISSSGSGRGSMATCGSVLGHSDPALAHGVDDGLRAVVHAELAQDAGHVVLDGLFADRQGVGDLLVGHALGDVVQDLHFARRERGEDRGRFLAVDGQLGELLENSARDGGLGENLVVDEVLAVGDAADDRD